MCADSLAEKENWLKSIEIAKTTSTVFEEPEKKLEGMVTLTDENSYPVG